MSNVTRIAWSQGLNPGKYAQLAEQAARLGCVRSAVWQRYSSVHGCGVGDREVRDQWMADGSGAGFGVLANPWKETVRDAMADIRACREAAKVKAREAIRRHTCDEQERRRFYRLLKSDRWADDRYLARIMRKYWRRDTTTRPIRSWSARISTRPGRWPTAVMCGWLCRGWSAGPGW